MEIKNASKETVYIYPKTAGECVNSFSYSVRHLTDKGTRSSCSNSWSVGCNDGPYPLQGGDEYSASWPLNLWYRFVHEGTYTATITRRMQISSASAGVKEFDFSSELQFRLVPADPAAAEKALRKFEADLSNKDPEVHHNALDAISTAAPPYLQRRNPAHGPQQGCV